MNSLKNQKYIPIVCSNYANCLIELNKYEKAIEVLFFSLSKNPKSSSALAKIAYIKCLHFDYQNSLNLCKSALTLVPTNLDYLNNTAVILKHLGKFESSKKFSDHIMSTASYQHLTNMNNSVSLNFMQDNLTGALGLCELINLNDPFSIDALVNLAGTL